MAVTQPRGTVMVRLTADQHCYPMIGDLGVQANHSHGDQGTIVCQQAHSTGECFTVEASASQFRGGRHGSINGYAIYGTLPWGVEASHGCHHR